MSNSQYLKYIFCLAGNILVLCVILRHRKMRNITNFFLANLAAADLCVGLFCIMQTLAIQLSSFWHLGEVSHVVATLSYSIKSAVTE